MNSAEFTINVVNFKINMKLNQFFDTKLDQNDIETKYLWIFDSWEITKPGLRIDLTTYLIDSFQIDTNNPFHILNVMPIPNNEFLGHGSYTDDSFEATKNLFISDEKLNVRSIHFSYGITSSFSCFYDSSIFLFDIIDYLYDLKIYVYRMKKYSMIKHKWIFLAALAFKDAISCIGINQKIVIASLSNEILVYDIFLNSYSQHYFNNAGDRKIGKKLLKIEGKIYMLVFPYSKIFCCEDPMKEWTILATLKENIKNPEFIVFNNGSWYYPKDTKAKAIYKFSLQNFKSQEIKIKHKSSKNSKISRFIKFFFN